MRTSVSVVLEALEERESEGNMSCIIFFFPKGNSPSVGWSEAVHKARSKGVCKEQPFLGITS